MLSQVLPGAKPDTKGEVSDRARALTAEQLMEVRRQLVLDSHYD